MHMPFSSQSRLADPSLVFDALSKSLAIIEFDPIGNILKANENFCRAMGYRADEIVGRHHSMFVDPTYARSAEYKAFWRQLGAGTFESREYKRIGAGGREVWIQASYNPVIDRRGKVIKVVKLATDITAEKLKAAENAGRLDALSRAEAVIEFTVDGTIVDANDNFLNALGYRLDEIKGQHHRMFVEPRYAASSDYADFWEKLGAGQFVSAEFKRIGKNGREVWIQASYNPILDMNGKVMKVVKFATDITGRIEAVNSIAEGLKRLADGDIAQRVDKPFIPTLDKLRIDFNASLEVVEKAMRQVGETAQSIYAATKEIQVASNDLARRTEQQAASVEQTASAIAEMTDSVKVSTRRAEEVGSLVTQTRNEAEASGEVVERAVAAMGKIETSSDQIVSIIGVIDEIAFQTNLLALNAGVEAARAGEAGRGFAVVAQEVRALAQRSATAAKEIKTLINESNAQVKSGAALVGETGQALKAIVKKVQDINAHVASIVEAARSQAVGLSEINKAVGSIDQGTQQNAAMVEESSAACHHLLDQTTTLNRLLGHFDVVQPDHDGVQSGSSSRTKSASTGSVVQLRTMSRSAPVAGNAALRSAPDAAPEWEEF